MEFICELFNKMGLLGIQFIELYSNRLILADCKILTVWTKTIIKICEMWVINIYIYIYI